MRWSLWSRIDVDEGRDLTLREFIDHFQVVARTAGGPSLARGPLGVGPEDGARRVVPRAADARPALNARFYNKLRLYIPVHGARFYNKLRLYSPALCAGYTIVVRQARGGDSVVAAASPQRGISHDRSRPRLNM